jgi:hypothetical protein
MGEVLPEVYGYVNNRIRIAIVRATPSDCEASVSTREHFNAESNILVPYLCRILRHESHAHLLEANPDFGPRPDCISISLLLLYDQ